MAGLYYDTLVNDKIKLEEKDELYCYARYFDAPDSMLFRSGCDEKIETNPKYQTITMKKAVMRATIERPSSFESSKRDRFIYLSGLPKKLLKNCAFQEDAKKFWEEKKINKDDSITIYYDEETLRWVLKYKNIDSCD